VLAERLFMLLLMHLPKVSELEAICEAARSGASANPEEMLPVRVNFFATLQCPGREQ
jgi:hypothetical protein